MSISRRDFLSASAVTAAGFALPGVASATPIVTDIRDRSELDPSKRSAPGTLPIVISAANGFTADDAGKKGIQVAYDKLVAGEDPLDAIVAGVQIVELNPHDQSVGLGGLPNEEGVVQLDASVMHGPTKRAGAVGALEDVATAAAVAKSVMDFTDHIMLVGAGAKKFALEMGFKEQNLLTDQSRQDWMRWKASLNPYDNWLDLPPRGGRGGGGREDDPRIVYTSGTMTGACRKHVRNDQHECRGPRAATSRRSRPRAASPGRFRVAWATARSLAQASTATTRSVRLGPPGAAKRTSRCAARSSPWSSCARARRLSKRS